MALHAPVATPPGAAKTEQRPVAPRFSDRETPPPPTRRATGSDREVAPAPAPLEVFEGRASWYGAEFAGQRTANGETFDPSQLTAAHRRLPFGTRLRVTNLATGLSVELRVNDRGPYAGNRVLDLSQAAAEAIGMRRAGVGTVRVEVLPG